MREKSVLSCIVDSCKCVGEDVKESGIWWLW